MIEHIDIVIPKLESMKSLYIERAIPAKYYEASLADLYYRYDRFEKIHGYRGLSEWDIHWLTDVFNARFYDIGVLRFQIFTMDHSLIERTGDDYMPLSEEVKQRFPEGKSYINIHITKDANLSPLNVEESIEEARTFFKTYFADYTFDYFICRTWLLDESLLQLLEPSSNILQFRDRFEILARNHHKAHPLMRIYGTSDLDEIHSMNHHSTLQKSAYKIADELGVSFGCIPFNRISLK